MSVVRSARLDGILTSTSKELDEFIITKEDEKRERLQTWCMTPG
jgi:hypothetical protein